MHADGDLSALSQTAGTWPADDRDPEWPDDWPAPPAPEPAARRRGRRLTALTLTALLALGAGAGAVYLFQNGLAGPTPAASQSQGSAASPGQGSTAGPIPDGSGAVRAMMLLGLVRAVGRDSVTVGGGPMADIVVHVTSATQFTGSARSLAQVQAGDRVAVQITESNGVATLVSLDDQSPH